LLSFNGLNNDSRALADGMNLSVVCNDGISFRAAAPLKFPLLDNWAQENLYSWACPLWPAAKSVRTHKPLQQNAVPVLLLSGEYDPATPSKWAENLVRNMGRSQLILFRGVGHDVIDTTECGGEVVADFLANPDAKIKTSCVAEMAGPQFSLPEGNPGAPMTMSVLPSMLHR
jgi:pimeloyl-ACP methyl ester carboxylesterase